jgi:hypothetical protein
MSTLNGGPGNIVTNGLVLYLDAANYLSYTSGSTTWNDLSGNNNSGSLVNGPTFSSGNAGSIVFDGADDYVNCGTQPSLNLTGGITLGCWVYFNNINRREIFVGKGDGIGAPSTQYWIEKTSNNNFLLLLSVVVGSIPTDSRLILNDFIIQNNQWYYVCLTYDKQTYRGYVNGIPNSQTTSMNFDIHTTSRNLGVGRLGDLPALHLLGRISAAQIYNRALTSSEVLQNYNATKARFGL